jgi:hypothetical protein
VSYLYREHCGWIPCELIRGFIIEAQRAQGVLEAFMKLRESQHVPEAVWRNIYKHDSPEMAKNGPSTERKIQKYQFYWDSSPEQGVRFGWSLLIALVNHYAAKPGGLAPCLIYDATRQRPELHIVCPLGFLPVVWSDIAQIISGVHQLYRCDGCKKLYQRTGRKPKAGQRNYCPACGSEGGYKESKRLSKAQKRKQA